MAIRSIEKKYAPAELLQITPFISTITAAIILILISSFPNREPDARSREVHEKKSQAVNHALHEN